MAPTAGRWSSISYGPLSNIDLMATPRTSTTEPLSTNSRTPRGRAAVREISISEPEPAQVEFQLANNTHLHGAPPAALRVIRSARDADLAQYPSPTGRELRLALADWIGVHPSEVVVGCGSEELIDCAYRALCEPGGRVACIAPTFVMARLFATTNALVPVAVPLTGEFDADAEALLGADPDLIYLCTPNNPTGVPLREETVRTIVERFHGPIVIDEAYAEFTDRSFACEAVESGRVVVLRTFSKAWGLAGLRVGYAVGAKDIVTPIETVRAPFKLNALGERAAAAALREDVAWMRAGVEETAALRERFSRELRALGRSPLPSSTNFVLIPVPNAGALAATLRSRGVAVRPFSKLPVVGDAVRVSIGPWEALRRVLDVFADGA